MAVENKWINANAEAGRRGPSSALSGGKKVTVMGNFEVAAADSNASVYKLARIPANAIPVPNECHVFADASIDGTDFDFGFYKNGPLGPQGADAIEVDKDVLADGLDLASGEAITAPLNMLTNLGGADPIANIGKKVWELLGLTVDSKREDYILAMTANVAGAAAGTIGYVFTYIVTD